MEKIEIYTIVCVYSACGKWMSRVSQSVAHTTA